MVVVVLTACVAANIIILNEFLFCYIWYVTLFISNFALEDQFSEYTWPRLIYSGLRVPAYHFYFEICLIIGIIWLLFKRSYNIHEKLKLSPKEKEQLIEEWEPQPLVPASWTPPQKLLERFHRASVGSIKK